MPFREVTEHNIFLEGKFTNSVTDEQTDTARLTLSVIPQEVKEKRFPEEKEDLFALPSPTNFYRKVNGKRGVDYEIRALRDSEVADWCDIYGHKHTSFTKVVYEYDFNEIALIVMTDKRNNIPNDTIAQRLNEVGYTTKSGKAWDSKLIREFYERL